MKKTTSIILGLLLVLVLVTASGAQRTAVANETEHATPTVTEEVTPTVIESISVTPTEECTPTPTEVTPTQETTPTPTEEKHEEVTPTPTVVPVLGTTTMAKSGSFGHTMMNLSGIFGMLFTAAGSLIYANKRKNQISA